jgi:hypothetical protein
VFLSLPTNAGIPPGTGQKKGMSMKRTKAGLSIGIALAFLLGLCGCEKNIQEARYPSNQPTQMVRK